MATEPLDTEPRAVLFDLDGTLLDTLADIAAAANAVLQRLGHPTHEPAAYKQFIGDGVEMLFRRALPHAADDLDRLRQCVWGFEESYNREWNIRTQLYDGVPELLDSLSARGVPMAVLSNKPHVFTCKCVDFYCGRWPFQAVLGQREGVARKPDPAGALEIAEICSLRPEQVLYLGDSLVDMRTARAAGMIPIGAAWGFRPTQELWDHGALAVIEHPSELSRFWRSGESTA